MAYDDNNVFARIIRGELPSHKVLEDEMTLAIMDITPVSRGHTLVMPKARARNILDIDDGTLSTLITRVRRVAVAAQKAMKSEGVTIRQFSEPAAGQTVFHMHFHVIPRWDGVPMRPEGGAAEKKETLAEQAALIRAALQ
jgi:histidine triad (HIT) family protein